MNKYLSFGGSKSAIDVKFTWYCSITKEKKVSPQPLHEMFSCLYNFAVAQMRQAVYMDLDAEGIKKACWHLQQSAWVFEHLIPLVSRIKEGEICEDFRKEALVMNMNLSLAQA